MKFFYCIDHLLAILLNSVQIEMIVFNGDENSASESIVKNSHPELKYIRINQLSELTPEMIEVEAEKIRGSI